MKTFIKLSVLIYVLLNPTLVFSQDYIKFPEGGSEWSVKYSWCGEMPCHISYFDYLYSGDTIINEKEYSIIKGRGSDIFVCDTNRIVFARNLSYAPDDSIVIYNFNLAVDDTFKIKIEDEFTFTFYVVQKDSLLIENTNRTILKLIPVPFDGFIDTLTWVEGIGSGFGPIYPLTLPGFEWTYALTCYQKGDINIYGECVKVGINAEPTRFELPLVKPNPVSDYSILNPGTKKEYILEIYSSSGILQKKEKITGKYTIWRSDFNQGIYKYRIIYLGTFYSGSFVIL